MSELLYRRKLRHWRQEQSTYCVTGGWLADSRKLDASERGLVAAALKRFEGQPYELLA